jgi:hypothetical protein
MYPTIFTAGVYTLQAAWGGDNIRTFGQKWGICVLFEQILIKSKKNLNIKTHEIFSGGS